MSYQQVFERSEKKYVISKKARDVLLERIAMHIQADIYGCYTICNLYFDTQEFQMIRNSMEKPIYKEKLRLRSYGTPNDTSTVFLELKKKFNGVVYKRRETMTLSQAKQYIDDGDGASDSQIQHEIDQVRNQYDNLHPAVYISYDRSAYMGNEDSSLRITFDTNILCRVENLALEAGVYGKPVIDEEFCIMEIKVLYAMPLWLTHALADLKIYPTQLSKYGTAYQSYILAEQKQARLAQNVAATRLQVAKKQRKEEKNYVNAII
ncbi:MAG: polyphosphate polymerase domain-containing protein [Erysipelotrichaceae bacterium]